MVLANISIWNSTMCQVKKKIMVLHWSTIIFSFHKFFFIMWLFNDYFMIFAVDFITQKNCITGIGKHHFVELRAQMCMPMYTTRTVAMMKTCLYKPVICKHFHFLNLSYSLESFANYVDQILPILTTQVFVLGSPEWQLWKKFKGWPCTLKFVS